MSLYSYNPNGQKVYDLLKDWDAISFACTMAEFAHSPFSNDDCSYTISKWYKFCDEVAEWLLYEDEAHANSLGIFTPSECAECLGKGWFENPIEHNSYCTQA